MPWRCLPASCPQGTNLLRGMHQRTARAKNCRFWLLNRLRAHTNAPYKTDLLWETLRALKRPGRPGQVGAPPANMKANRWFELEYAFVDTDGIGGEAYVQLCDHSVKMGQLLEDLACDNLAPPQSLICRSAESC